MPTTSQDTPHLFPTGGLYATPGAKSFLQCQGLTTLDIFERHVSGDWSEMDAEDQASNRNAVENGGRVVSAYLLKGQKIWIITEADRSVTTILLPSEY